MSLILNNDVKSVLTMEIKLKASEDGHREAARSAAVCGRSLTDV